ncbi:Arylacetamide deacetylase-like 2 [Cladobotryum mycophilum]|uniref:Arylacetamide deacetylase-like 2 n=1 Tax=Cladobotryum mycophilum TaxID=491253 RepID=A0ABR0SJN8_9HYPO
MALSILRTLHMWLRPSIIALFDPKIPWYLRWRTLCFQPVSLITYTIGIFPYLFSQEFTVEYLPISDDRSIRALVFRSSDGKGKGRKLRPLHVEVHGGAFIGGLAESNAAFDECVAKETGAVVVSITYRFAPEHGFPAAIDDVDATIRWIQENAVNRWGADPELMTVGGFSAGGHLVVAASQQERCHAPSSIAFKASVTFYAPLDLRVRPIDKPRPESFPKQDPLAFLLPLFDAYAIAARAKHMQDPRLNPTLTNRETLPERMLLIVPLIDILVSEQMAFAERVNEEDKRDGMKHRVEVMTEKEGFHGYLEAPDFAVKREVKDRAFTRGVEFLRETYARYGWAWEY